MARPEEGEGGGGGGPSDGTLLQALCGYMLFIGATKLWKISLANKLIKKKLPSPMNSYGKRNKKIRAEKYHHQF